jgi:hypothetical protein
MLFQFCCPLGHVLQGDPSQVGQIFQCPMCGSNFLIPPPGPSQPPPPAFSPEARAWPVANASGGAFPGQGSMPGMMPSGMVPLPGGPAQTGSFPNPMPQPFVFAPGAANPPGEAGSPPASPTEGRQQPQATPPQNETGKPRFDLGFDPHAKESLPFDIPGESDGVVAPPPDPGLPPSAFPLPSFPVSPQGEANFPAQPLPTPTLAAPIPLPVTGGQDFFQPAPVPAEEAPVPQARPKVLHIRCPSGHLVKARSDLLGKAGRCPACKKTFELRYEDSIEFQRRTEKILQREEIKTGKAWMAWAFLAAFLVFMGLAGLIVVLNR